MDLKLQYGLYKAHGEEIMELESKIDALRVKRSDIANSIHREIGSQTFEVAGEHFKVIKKSDGSAFIRSAKPKGEAAE